MAAAIRIPSENATGPTFFRVRTFSLLSVNTNSPVYDSDSG